MVDMSEWFAISDFPVEADDDRPLAEGLFLCEVSLPIQNPTVLIDCQDDPTRTFSLFADPEQGLVLIYRNGQSLRRIELKGALPGGVGIGRFSFWWSLELNRWRMTFGRLGHVGELKANGSDPFAVSLTDLAVICQSDSLGLRHPSVLWFGVTRGSAPPHRAPWIGLRTPIETARGPVAAGNLRIGDMVVTLDSGLVPILNIVKRRLPSRGSFAPIVLRAPFLGQMTDLLVAVDQLVLRRGPTIEYLFGEEEVLIPAGALDDGMVARRDNRFAVASGIELDLGMPEIVLADGVGLLTSGPLANQPRKALADYEVQQLRSMLTAVGGRSVA